MGHYNEGPETSYDERVKRHLQVLYARKTRERQVFMHELQQYRKKKHKKLLQTITDEIGPRWYQALSVLQRAALDTLESCMYQDVLAGRPQKTINVIRDLGLYPRPNRSDLMTCIYLGKENPMEMLAQLYYHTYGYPIEGKRLSYNLNAKLILSAIFYLGLDNLISLLREKFRPDKTVKEPIQKPKPKPKPRLASPYLEKLVAALWEKPVHKRKPPPPLPNLDDLDDPYEEEPVIHKPPPPPPPPPPPKKRLPREICDAMAGVRPAIKPRKSTESLAIKRPVKLSQRKNRLSKANIPEGKKVYGIGINFRKKTTSRRKKIKPPSTGIENAQYTINGVYERNGKSIFILGNVSILPNQGDFIHGGHAFVKNDYIKIHCGYRGRPPPPKPDPCDCVKEWTDSVMKYVKGTKCYCGHRYDFGNEGQFLPEELPFFVKPTGYSPWQLKYQTIFNLDEKQLHVEKEFKKVWDTDSMLHVDDGKQVAKDDKKKKKKRSSKTCLGLNPKPEDYLKCALRFMRRLNVAARLPDLHLVPELKEWMRQRLYGPLNQEEKAEYLRKSTTYWQFFSTLAVKGFGHVAPPRVPEFVGHTNWLHKQKLNDKFMGYILNYRLSMYRSHAHVTNLLWRTMYQAEFPDKQFRAIYFSYLFGKPEDLQLMDPYQVVKVNERKTLLRNKRYVCLPAGAEDLEV